MLANTRRAALGFKFVRKITNACVHEKATNNYKMNAWQVHSYGDELLRSSTRTPIVNEVNEVLVKVEAASVNPIDLLMKEGYARTVLNVLRKSDMELPLTLGRDFCGTIVSKGLASNSKFKMGDKVYGFVPLHKQGSFAEYVLAESDHICFQPEHLKPTECTSVVYAAMTAWSALFITGGLQFENTKNKRILVLGASGGVGTMAVQLLKTQGVQVIGTCSTNAVPLVRSLGADEVIDYTQPDYLKQIAESRYDIILDCAKFGVNNLPTNWKFKQFITLNSPLMLNTDKYGLLPGVLKSATTLVGDNIVILKDGKVIKWGFFLPCKKGFELINGLLTKKEIRPITHKEFDFDEIPDALAEVNKGHLRGKVVINVK
ncbi:hypothetical protein WA026_001043 [Henosepilachna vigintioctopunctata]|uniref:Enoyl reductase (ER) domain-containing protein n=1 Tax=Henosepilachna vigintioctopunctata TaxID=420089 RepID=A0AAW1V2E1_9CUCU